MVGQAGSWSIVHRAMLRGAAMRCDRFYKFTVACFRVNWEMEFIILRTKLANAFFQLAILLISWTDLFICFVTVLQIKDLRDIQEFASRILCQFEWAI